MQRFTHVGEEYEVKPGTGNERNDNADEGDDEGGETGFFEFFEVGVQTGHEHQKDDADF